MAYTIMVVDDSETIRMVLERTIHMTQLPVDEIIHAENGREALKLFKEHSEIDLVLLDIKMPEMDGFAMIEKLENRDFNLIFTTAHD